MKWIKSLVIMLFVSSLFAENIEEKVKQNLSVILPNLIEKVQSNQALAILPFDNDENQFWHNIVLQELHKYADFTLIDIENLDKLVTQGVLQKDPLFKQNAKKLGDFIPADLVVIGKVIHPQKIHRFLHKSEEIKIHFKLDEIHTGKNLCSQSLSVQVKKGFNWRSFAIYFLSFYLFFRILNFFTKGYYAKILIMLWILTVAGWTFWYLIL